ncbi:MAG: ABC transporter ATP-binding protein [Kiritimatiellae bacterium]|jgi:ABC-type multidrug transport system fused ATPase/permease subunit|nr:ABC transporter ATP-binding protein [Kiritimatiellia bacterium]
MRPHRARFMRIILLYLLNAVMNLLPAASVGIFVDVVISERSASFFGLTIEAAPLLEKYSRGQLIGGYVGFMVCLILIANLIGVVMWRRMTDAVQEVLLEIKMDIRAHLNRLSMSYFQRERTGAVMERALGDVQKLEMLFKTWFFLFYNLLQFLIAPVLMLAQSRILFVAVLLPTPLIVYSVWTIQRKLKPLYRELREKESSAAAIMQESVSGIREIKAYTLEERSNELYEDVQRGVRDQNLDIMRIFSVTHQVQYSTQDLALVCIATGGALLLWGGFAGVTAGTITSYIALTGHFFNPIRTFVGMFETIQRGMVSWDRIREFMEEEDRELDYAGGIHIKRHEVAGAVRFENVYFGYNSDRSVINGIDLEVAPGEKIGLVGSTGCGKSTLMSLLPRFHEPSQGRILLDGRDITEINRRSLRGQIGIVFQDTFLFYGTILENLLFVNPNRSREDIETACEAAGILERIRELPNGFNTRVGERGQQLSGGEKQRFSIARLLLKDPAIVLLDEATSALDTATERHVQRHFETLLQGRTAFIIAHRLTTVQTCDRILLMDDGRITEMGSHRDLLDLNGRYADLWRGSEDRR